MKYFLISLFSQGDGNKPLTDVNPTTRLMEYQKKRHAKEPVYILVEEKGRGRKKQFSIEVRMLHTRLFS